MKRSESDEVREIVRDHGLSPDGASEWYTKYTNHVKTSKTRGVPSELTFEQYLSKVVAGGLSDPQQIGVTLGKFVLGRVGDEGNYSVGNCRFITTTQNHIERFENGRNVEGDKRRSEKMKGQTAQTSESVRRTVELCKGQTKETSERYRAISNSRSRNFVLIDPSGREHRGRNLMEFCQQHDLNHSALYMVFAGTRNHHKGWTGYYTE